MKYGVQWISKMFNWYQNANSYPNPKANPLLSNNDINYVKEEIKCILDFRWR